MRYLITGATGFIGSQIMRRLVDMGEEVHIITKKESNFWRIEGVIDRVTCHLSDLSDVGELAKIMNKVNPDVIHHLATYGAYPYQNEQDKIMYTNIFGTRNLLEACADVDYKLFVNTGSSSEYGFKELPMKETDLLDPMSYYAVTKSSQTQLCSYIAQMENKPIVTLRPFSVYGLYEEPTRFIPTLMKALYFNEGMNLVFPKISHDYIYVEDVVDIYLMVDQLRKFVGDIFNVGTGIQSSIKDVVDTAIEVTGETTDFKWEMKCRPWDTYTWVADISKAKRLLNWSPRVSLRKGISLIWKSQGF
jgi:nucleoside-diphosphate-sugar epimerase